MRYFIHVNAGRDSASDDVGQELPDLASARTEAVEAAWEIISLKLRQGEVVSPAWSIEIADSQGNLIEALSLERIVFGASLQDRHSRVFEVLPHPYLLLSSDLAILEANRAFLKATSTNLGLISQRPLFDVFPENPGDPEATGVRNVSASLQRVLSQKQPQVVPQQRYDIRRPDGSWEERHWKMAALPVLDDRGEADLIVLSLEDVTQAVARTRAHSRPAPPPRDPSAAAPSAVRPWRRGGEPRRRFSGRQLARAAVIILSLGITYLAIDYAYLRYEDDYPASTATTGRVPVGGSTTGHIERAGDADWFKVELTSNKPYRIELEGSHTGQGTLRSPVVRLLDDKGKELHRDSGGGAGLTRTAALTYTPASAGTYHVSCEAEDRQTGTYKLSVREHSDQAADMK